MNGEELTAAVRFELDAMRIVVQELSAILSDVRGTEPTLRERTAAGAFLSQFYMGIENILKRISQYYGEPLPEGRTGTSRCWSASVSRTSSLSRAVRQTLERAVDPFRRFRHVVAHGYGFQLEWERMYERVEQVEPVFERFVRQITAFLL